MFNKESSSSSLLQSSRNIEDHGNGRPQNPFAYYHGHAFLSQNQDLFPLYQPLQETFSRLSLNPQNPLISMNLGDERYHGYPLTQQRGSNSNNNNVGLLQSVPWFNNINNEFDFSTNVPVLSSEPSYGINMLRSRLSASALEREYQGIISNEPHSVFRGRTFGRVNVRDRDLSNNRRNNNCFNNRHLRCLLRNSNNQQETLSPRSVYELKGNILGLAKHECGCKALKETMKSLTTQEEVLIVFQELIDHVAELMSDPSGNSVFQKLVEICSDEQRTQIVLMVTKNDFHLVTMCLDTHGTRAVQSLLNNVTNQEQRSLIMLALSPNAAILAKDMNGFHVIQNCLHNFSKEDTMYMMIVIANNCFEIASDKSGCCVMQLCVDHAEGEVKEKLMRQIIVNAYLLSENCYGNYVVQHLVSLQIPRVTEGIMRQLQGKFLLLSCNKFGSNVVEKLFKKAGEHNFKRIVLELLCDPDFTVLLVDPYGNYVFSSAVKRSQGEILRTLVEIVELHIPLMRSNLYGKKLLASLKEKMPHIFDM